VSVCACLLILAATSRRLSGNPLIGSLPVSVCNSPKLERYYVEHTLLSGTVPRCYETLTNLLALYVASSLHELEAREELTLLVGTQWFERGKVDGRLCITLQHDETRAFIPGLQPAHGHCAVLTFTKSSDIVRRVLPTENATGQKH